MSSQVQSFCVDGDIKLAAGQHVEATEAFLRAHIADAGATESHLLSLTEDERNRILAILQNWTKVFAEEKERIAEDVGADQVWELIFSIDEEAVTSCLAVIDNLFKEKQFKQVISLCSALLRRTPSDVVPLLLQRALSQTLLGGHEKQAIADYLRAFLKDKGETINIVERRQSDYVIKVKTLMANCVYSKSPPATDPKPLKQWVALTIDCCRFLLSFEPDNFELQMTFISRLMDSHRYERATTILDEIIERQLPTDHRIEVLLRRAACNFFKQNNDRALNDIITGLNARFTNIDDDDVTTLLNGDERTFLIAAKVFNEKTKPLAEVEREVEKAATKLTQEERFKAAVKLENLRAAIDHYRALLIIQPQRPDRAFKLAECYAKFGKVRTAIKIFNRQLEDTQPQINPTLLAARAACHRELGEKEAAKMDYDLLLRHSPRDITLLCERALVHMENDDIALAVGDLLAASSINKKAVVSRLNREPLAGRTRTRQTLFDYAKEKLLQFSADVDFSNTRKDVDDDSSAVALGISQLLTKLNPADLSGHILVAHALFHNGCANDAETKLKQMLQNKSQRIEAHVIRLHLGIMKLFTNRREEGMNEMIAILTGKGDRLFSALLRDLPLPERARLSEESHRHGIALLQKGRDPGSVQRAVHCFSIAILLCRETDLVLEGRNDGTGFFRSYLARAECMAYLGDQRAAILDFSAAVEIHPSCIDGFCGRAFMRLALGEETECVADVAVACDLDLDNVVSHVHALPDEAKKLLLFWIDHRVIALLLNYGYRSNERIDTGGSASTISMLDETTFKPGENPSPSSSLSSFQQTTNMEDSTSARSISQDHNKPKAFCKPNATAEHIDDVVVPLQQEQETESYQFRSRGSTATTTTLLHECDDSIEKSEILNKALSLSRLLVAVDSANASWQSMLADALIVRGDYDEALRHLQNVIELTPNDVTAIARAGLINVKMNRYKIACRLLSSIAAAESSGLRYVLKALDASRRRRLCEEAFNNAELLNREGKYAASRDCYSLSLMADSFNKLDCLRMRSRCHGKLGDTRKAIADINDVIKELVRKPQSHDFCYRGSLYLLENKDFQACRDYMKAIAIDKIQASSLIHVRPGREALCDVFYKQALTSFTRHNYQDCVEMCDAALLVDDSNIDIRKLRARARREESRCIVQ